MYSASLDGLLTPDASVLPHLRRLKLLGFRASPDAAVRFLAAHPGLTYVHVGHEGTADPEDDFGQGEVSELPQGVLPNVTEFYVNGMKDAWEAALEDGTKRPLTSL